MARTASNITVTVEGNLGPLDQMTTGSREPLTIAVVDASGNQVTSFGSGTQYAVSDAAGGTDSGNLALVVRDDALTTLTPSDGDYVQMRTDSQGALWIRPKSTDVFSGTRVYIQNASDVGTASSISQSGLEVNLTQLKGVTLDTNSGNKSEGSQRVVIATDDINLAAINASVSVLDDWDETNRAAVNIIAGQVGVAGGTGVDAATVQRVSLATNVALPAGTNNIGDVDVASIAAGDNNIGNVDLASSIPAGTNNIGDVDVLTIPGIVGTIADDATTPGNPVMIGGTAKNFDGTDPGNVSAEDDVTRLITDRNRRLFVNTVHPQMWSYHTDRAAGLANITDKSIAADPGDNFSIFVTDIAISSSAVTSGLAVFLEEGSTKVLGPYFLEAGSTGRGAMISFQTPKKITASTALTLSTLQEGSGRVEYSIDVHGFVARVD